jgi:hypothetical protein
MLASWAALMLPALGCNRELLDEINAAGKADFAAACLDVIRQVDAKRITMYAVVPAASGTTDVGGYRVEVVSNPDIIAGHRKWSGTYHNHHNGVVLTFAAVQLREGNRELGLYLLRTLARIDPDHEWSNARLGNRPIKRILEGIEANDGTMDDFLRDEQEQWRWRIERYGMPRRAAAWRRHRPWRASRGLEALELRCRR